jgi:FKBP-type peptidyl-prolyl cis-trans isomerase
MKKLFLFTALIIALVAVIVSCKDDGLDLEALRAEELRLLKEYIEANNYEDSVKPSGLYYILTQAGTGDSLIKTGDRVEIFYTGTKLWNGEEFDGTGNFETYKFIVGDPNVIAGMNEGLTYMRQGEKATLVIPSNLAYGASNSSVERFSTLIFDIEVYKHFR